MPRRDTGANMACASSDNHVCSRETPMPRRKASAVAYPVLTRCQLSCECSMSHMIRHTKSVVLSVIAHSPGEKGAKIFEASVIQELCSWGMAMVRPTSPRKGWVKIAFCCRGTVTKYMAKYLEARDPAEDAVKSRCSRVPGPCAHVRRITVHHVVDAAVVLRRIANRTAAKLRAVANAVLAQTGR